MMKVWYLDTEENGQKTLYAPNGEKLFTVNPDTLEMLGQMFLGEVEDENEDTWESLGRGFVEHEPDQTYGAANG